MTCLDEFISEVNSANHIFDHHLSLVETYVESACSIYDQEFEKIGLRCMTESVSDSEREFLYEEASEGLRKKLSNAISKTSDNLSEFNTTIKEKVNKINQSLGATGKLRKIQMKVQDNPFLNKVSVSVPKDKALFTNGGSYQSMISSATKAVMKNDANGVKSVEDNFTKIIKSKETILDEKNLGKLIEELVALNNNLNKIVETSKANIDKSMHALDNIHTESTEHQKLIAKTKPLITKIYHREVNMKIQYFTDALSALEKAVKKNKKVSGDITESAIMNMDLNIPDLDDDFMESMFNDFMNEVSDKEFDDSHVLTFESEIDDMMGTIMNESSISVIDVPLKNGRDKTDFDLFCDQFSF